MTGLMAKTIATKKSRWNTDIVNGFAGKELDKAPDYLDRIIRSGMKTLHPDIPLEYKGYRIMTPIEDFKHQIATSTSKNQVDISKNSIYKVAFMFSYAGEDFEKIIALPYVEDNVFIYLSDTMYNVVPVLSEYVLNFTKTEAFIRLLKDKQTIKAMKKQILEDGIRKSASVLYANLYRFDDEANKKIPITLLIMLKFGFYGTFKKACGCKPIIGIGEPEVDRDKYTVYQSLGRKPRMLKDGDYKPHNIYIAIPKNKTNKTTETLIASLFHVFDMVNIFSTRLPEILAGKSRMSEKDFWKILLGKTIFRNSYDVNKIITLMNEYTNVIAGYIDDIVKEKLHAVGVMVEDYYDLLYYVLDNFHARILTAEDTSASIDNRYLDVLYYLMYEIMEGFHKTFYNLNKDWDKKRDSLVVKDVKNRIFNKQLGTRRIFNLIKGGTNIAISLVDYSGDNKYPKITVQLEDRLVPCGSNAA